MALTMPAVTSFTSGAPLIGVRRSPSPCMRAKAMSPRSSLVLPGGDECSLSNVDYGDATSQWISPDFLNLRLRSSSLMCNEAVQALRKHFEVRKSAAATTHEHDVAEVAPSACEAKTSVMPVVTVYDEDLFAQLYSPGSTYATMSCFLDESFC